MPKQIEVPSQGSQEPGSPEFKLKRIVTPCIRVCVNVSPRSITLQLHHAPGEENLQELGQDLQF